MPEPRRAKMVPDREDAVEVLQEPLKRLREARAAIDRERREADATLLAKNAAIEAFDDTFIAVSHCYEAGMRMGGQEELAKKFRPSVRRPGRRLIDVNGEGEPEEAAVAGEEPSVEEPSIEPSPIEPPPIEPLSIEPQSAGSATGDSTPPEGIEGASA